MPAQILYNLVFESPCFVFSLFCFATLSECKQPQLFVSPQRRLRELLTHSFPQEHLQFQLYHFLPDFNGVGGASERTVNRPNFIPDKSFLTDAMATPSFLQCKSQPHLPHEQAKQEETARKHFQHPCCHPMTPCGS